MQYLTWFYSGRYCKHFKIWFALANVLEWIAFKIIYTKATTNLVCKSRTLVYIWCSNQFCTVINLISCFLDRMEILEQINLAPRIYALTVKEVVRRREFTSQFAKVNYQSVYVWTGFEKWYHGLSTHMWTRLLFKKMNLYSIFLNLNLFNLV
jgi:hypothetical protein